MYVPRLIPTCGLICLFLICLPSPLLAQQPPPAEGNEAALIAVLESNATLFDKAKACQQLATVGTEACVPTLTKLLADEQLSHYARYALEPIPDKSVDDALRTALRQLEGRHLVGVIQSIGTRRDANAATDLEKLLLNHTDPEVAAAAASTLGRIGSPQAVEMLKAALQGPPPLRPAVADACLTVADQFLANKKSQQATDLLETLLKTDLPKHLQIAAMYGALKCRGSDDLQLLTEQLRSEDDDFFQVALSMAYELPGENVTRALIDAIQPDPNPDVRQALLIYGLGARGDRAALPAILELAQTGPAESRLAAVRVLAKLGDVTAVPILLQIAIRSQGEISEDARTSLANIAGTSIDTVLTDQLTTSEGPERLLLIELAGRRGITAAAGHLIQLVDQDDPAVRIAAIDALGTTISLDQLHVLIDRLINPKSPAIASAANESLRKACLRMPDRDACALQFIRRLPSSPTEAQKAMLALLGVVGGPKALEGVAAAAKGDDEALHDKATDVLGRWTSPDAAPVLLELAQASDYPYRNRTLRGYIGVARRFDYSAEQRIAMCLRALEVAARDDEKKIVFDVLKEKIPSPESLAIIVSYLKQDSLKDAASTTVLAIAEEIAPTHPESAAEALRQVLEATTNQDVTSQAKKLLQEIGQ